ncbi:MAG: restriction endonuclease subunit S [Nevskia sp.]|nr:restriction endonuclease subunit S [Nevskia sp.]
MEIAEGWIATKLGEIAEFEMGQAPPGEASNFCGRGSPFVKAGEFGEMRPVIREWTTVPLKFGHATDVFICVVGATAGKLNLGAECAIGRSVAAIRPNIVEMQPFIYYQLLPKVLELRAQSSGSAQSVISQKDLSKVEVLIAPMQEQTRIVTKLEELLSDLDTGVAELKAAQKKLAQYRQSLLKSAVEGRLTADWRAARAVNPSPSGRGAGVRDSQSGQRQHPAENPSSAPSGHLLPEGEGKSAAPPSTIETGTDLLARILIERRARWEAKQLARFKEQGKTPPKDWRASYPEPVAPDTAGLPSLPEGWVWATVDQLARVGTGVTPLRSRIEYFQQGTIPWITSGALNDVVVSAASELVTKLAFDQCRLDLFPAGTLLVAMYGEGKTRGKCSELAFPATINQAIAALVCEFDAESCRQYLKMFLLNSYELMRQQASGGVQPNLNLQIVRSLAVPLPPVAEQGEIVRLLNTQSDEITGLRDATNLALKQSTAQRKNILRAAFAGQLVLQDPNDEPASALLARIRAKQADCATARPARGRARKTDRSTTC